MSDNDKIIALLEDIKRSVDSHAAEWRKAHDEAVAVREKIEVDRAERLKDFEDARRRADARSNFRLIVTLGALFILYALFEIFMRLLNHGPS